MYKFFVNQSQFATCPIVVVETVSVLGIANTFIARGYVARNDRYTLFRSGKGNSEGAWICPTMAYAGPGWWYVAVYGASPTWSSISYRLRVRTVRPLLCADIPPTPTSLNVTSSVPPGVILLNDTRPYWALMQPKQYQVSTSSMTAVCNHCLCCLCL